MGIKVIFLPNYRVSLAPNLLKGLGLPSQYGNVWGQWSFRVVNSGICLGRGGCSDREPRMAKDRVYRLARAQTAEAFERKVNRLLGAGYWLQGSPIVVSVGENVGFYQAVMKPPEFNPEATRPA
jgi:hypothetical protein